MTTSTPHMPGKGAGGEAVGGAPAGGRPWPGFFISFEGGDGVGKSTQVARLADALRGGSLRGEVGEVIVTREPGGSPGAEDIRTLLVAGAVDHWSPMSEALLMMAARVDHLERTILPALKRGAVVVCDRFFDSTMAYQGIAGALGQETVTALRDLAIGTVAPDITFILTLGSEQGLARAGARAGSGGGGLDTGDRFERKGEDFQARVHKAFEVIAAQNPGRCVVIDGGADIAAVHGVILATLRARFCWGGEVRHG